MNFSKTINTLGRNRLYLSRHAQTTTPYINVEGTKGGALLLCEKGSDLNGSSDPMVNVSRLPLLALHTFFFSPNEKIFKIFSQLEFIHIHTYIHRKLKLRNSSFVTFVFESHIYLKCVFPWN